MKNNNSAIQLHPLADFRAQEELRAEFAARSPLPVNKFGAFNQVEVDLSATDVQPSTRVGKTMGSSGYGIYFLRRGSNPGAVLTLDVGGTLKTFGPGDWFTATFDDFKVRIAPGGAVVGKAQLLVITNPQVTFGEIPAQVLNAQPETLLGTVSGTTITPITVAKDVDPTGVMPVGAFDATGWKLLRVLVDTQSNGDNATSFDLVPWNDPLNSGQWFEQGSDRISVPDTDTTKGRYRVFTLNVAGAGRMYFAIRNLLEAARTGLSFTVQGLQ